MSDHSKCIAPEDRKRTRGERAVDTGTGVSLELSAEIAGKRGKRVDVFHWMQLHTSLREIEQLCQSQAGAPLRSRARQAAPWWVSAVALRASR
jgi:hypothetical protein